MDWWKMVSVSVAAALVILLTLWALNNHKDSPPEVQLGLVIVFGVVALMVMLFLLVAGFRAFGLTNTTEALGLPAGSVRALIALILIMVFVVLGLYLFRTVGEGNATLHGVTQAQVTALGDRVTSATPISGTAKLFDVTLRGDFSDDGTRLAQQLVTTLGTLVVAVSAFYFGTAAAKGAKPGP